MRHWIGNMRTSVGKRKDRGRLKMLCSAQWAKNCRRKRNALTFALPICSLKSSSRTKWKDSSQTITLSNQPTIRSVAAPMSVIPSNLSQGSSTERRITDSYFRESLKSNISLRICVQIERLLKPNSILSNKEGTNFMIMQCNKAEHQPDWRNNLNNSRRNLKGLGIN